MAESLVELDDPLAAELDPGERRAARDVLETIRSALAPVEAPVAAPSWLRPEQAAPFRRVVGALERHGTALLADPTGSGKSYIALAAAQHHASRHPVVVLAPAVIRTQWQETARQLGIAIVVHSHEMISRGQLPKAVSPLVIVDESHRFRNPGIRRYRELGRWLRGGRLLLLTATPVVNRLEDLGHQLLLGLRSDALAVDGVPDILASLGRGRCDPAFGQVILCRPAHSDRPKAFRQMIHWTVPAVFGEWIDAIDRLALSSDAGVAALIRMTLWRALSSSTVALAGALKRYLALLEHAQAAVKGGREVTRAEIRRFSSMGLDQLVLWELLPEGGAPADLVLGDLAPLRDLLASVEKREDPRLGQLVDLLRDGRTTIVFTASRDTLSALRARAGPRVAWICGGEAGLGHLRVPPTTVLGWFRPGPASSGGMQPPHALLATDVAAEGLDLQRAERIVHHDLPWTPMRIDQREGRAVRLGNRNVAVEILRWSAWPALEVRMNQMERLLQKRRTVSQTGLDSASHWLYRWRSEFASGDAGPPAHAAVAGDRAGWLAAVAFDRVMGSGHVQRVPAELLWLPDQGEVVDDPAMTTLLLDEAAHVAESSATDTVEVRARLADWIRIRLKAGDTSRWLANEPAGDQRRLIRRLHRLARAAAGARDATLLDLLQRSVDAISGGLTAGEIQRVQELCAADDGRLLAQLAIRPFARRSAVIVVPRLRGLLRINFPA